jgi:hypothetical protein
VTHLPPDPQPDDDDELARRVAGALRRLGPRRAPPALESRVLAQIARRQSTPWALRSFSHWPPLARAAFLAASFALIGVVLAGVPGMASLAPLERLTPGAWLHLVGAAAASLQSAADGAQATWLKIFLAAAAGLYAALFGLGAAAYRLLYLQPRAARS